MSKARWRQPAQIRWFGMVAAMVLGCLLAGCSQNSVNIIVNTPPPLPTATPLTVTNGQITYDSVDQLYQVKYPAAWQSNPLISTEGIPDGRDFSTPDGSTHFTVLPLQGTTPAQVVPFLTNYLHDDGASGSAIGVAGSLAKLGANTWMTRPFAFTMQGTSYAGVAYTASHATFTVVVLTYADKADYPTVTASILQPMLATFTFVH